MQSLTEAANYSGYQTRMSLSSSGQGRNFCEYDVYHSPILELLQRNLNSANVQQVCVFLHNRNAAGTNGRGKNNANRQRAKLFERPFCAGAETGKPGKVLLSQYRKP
jgi:hypothetical protein